MFVCLRKICCRVNKKIKTNTKHILNNKNRIKKKSCAHQYEKMFMMTIHGKNWRCL